MEYVYSGASIECAGAEIVSRKIVIQSVVEMPDLGRCKKYSCERNSESIIKKELSPKNPILKRESHLNLGDALRAEQIIVLIQRGGDIDVQVVDKTHRHNAQRAYSNCFTFAQIAKQFPNLGTIKDIKQTPPINQKLLKEAKE